jgi:hypothetical protein
LRVGVETGRDVRAIERITKDVVETAALVEGLGMGMSEGVVGCKLDVSC